MDAYRTEDEQVEALKRWWKENGTSTLVTIALVVGGYFGWQVWTKNKLEQQAAASANYQQLLQVAMELEQDANDARYATATHLVDTLKTDYPKTLYAHYAALMQAKLLVEQKDFDAAQAQLRWVIDNDPEPELRQLANLRLARILFATGEAEKALEQMNSADYGEFAPIYYELRGDIHSSLGDLEAARQDYQSALASNLGNPNATPLVRMKLESLPRDTAKQVDIANDES